MFDGFGGFDGFFHFPPPMIADNGPRETGMAAHFWRFDGFGGFDGFGVATHRPRPQPPFPAF